ncbi:MAG: hypothetical protein ACLQU3_16515 [Limisphaerales bacterium]
MNAVSSGNRETGGSFRAFWNAIATMDVENMGVRAVLTALLKLACSKGKAKGLGLENTLQCYNGLEAIHGQAKARDPVAFAELLALATIANAMLAEVADEHKDLAKPFARASVAWPILQPYYRSGKGDSPQERLGELGFGENAKAARLRGFTNRFALAAVLLHIFSALKAVLAGDAQRLKSSSGNGHQAKTEWEQSACRTLDAAVPRLSDLTFEEVQNLRRTRGGRVKQMGRAPEVSGDVRAEIKGWFLRLSGLVQGWRNIGAPPPGSNCSR